MDTRAKTDECLILRGRDYKETDRLLVVFSRRFGKFSCLAKGVRRANSKLKASTQLFSYSRLTFTASKSLPLVTQGEAVEARAELRDDLTKIACASYIGEMLDAVLPENKPQEGVFVLAAAALTLLTSLDEPFLLLSCFDLRLLSALGYRLNFDACASCGRSTQGESFYVCPERGGVICTGCRGRLTAGLAEQPLPPKLSAGACRLLAGLLNWDLRRVFNVKATLAMRQEIDAALAFYLAYYLGAPAVRAKENLSVYYKV